MSGRVYTMGHEDREAPECPRDERSSIDVAGMPRELKPLLLGRIGRDLDLVNAQPTLLSQLARTLTWADGRAAPRRARSRARTDRAACIAEVAEVHAIEGSYEHVKDIREAAVHRSRRGTRAAARAGGADGGAVVRPLAVCRAL